MKSILFLPLYLFTSSTTTTKSNLKYDSRSCTKLNDALIKPDDDSITSVGSMKRFYVDGNNLMGHKVTPKNHQNIANQLYNISNAEIMLVFDGPKQKDDVETTITNIIQKIDTNNLLFQQINLGTGLSADEYIKDSIKEILLMKGTKVEVVTADRILRREVLLMKPIVKGVINPVVFWKRYRPRLTGLKSNYQNNNEQPTN